MATGYSAAKLAVEQWTGWFDAPSGAAMIALAADEQGITQLVLLPDDADADAATPQRTDVPPPPRNPHLKAAVEQLRGYFAGRLSQFTVPISARGTPFQKRVWDAATQIPAGQTRSYWWVAVRLGDPFAARAVGGALGANPVPILVPCHRVLRKNNALGGFTVGLDWKRRLLDHEAALASPG